MTLNQTRRQLSAAIGAASTAALLGSPTLARGQADGPIRIGWAISKTTART